MTTLKRVSIENCYNDEHLRQIKSLAEEVLESIVEENSSIEEAWYEDGEVYFAFTEEACDDEDFEVLMHEADAQFDENFSLRARTEYPNWF